MHLLLSRNFLKSAVPRGIRSATLVCKCPRISLQLTRSMLTTEKYFCRTVNSTSQIKCTNSHTICVNKFFKLYPVARRFVTNNKSNAPSATRGRKTAVTGQEIKRLFGLAKDEKWKLTGAVFLLFISSAVTMSVPFCMGKVIDIIYTSDPETMKANLTAVTQVLLLMFTFGAAANFGRVYLMQTTGYRITQKLRVELFSSIVKQEVAFFDKNQTGELINRLSADTSLVGNSLSLNISDGLRSGVSVIAGVSLMFYVSSDLALLGLATVPPIAGLTIIYGRYIRKITSSIQDALAGSTQVAEERIANIRTVRAFAQEAKEVLTYQNRINSVLTIMYKESLLKGVFFGATGLSGNIIVLSVLYYGGLLMVNSQITVGELSSFLLYAAYVGISLGGLTSAYSEVMKGLGASTRLWQIIDRVPAIPLSTGIIPVGNTVGEVEFCNVTFRYPLRPEVFIFNHFSLKVPSGSVTAVVGSSGSGKSTLANLLLRFYDPESGKIFIDGVDIAILNPEWVRTIIGTVSQEPVLFSCSVQDNILYGVSKRSSVNEEQLISVCKEANAYEFIQNFPEKFNSLVGERGLMLSGGQRQRIAIARALLKNPRILLLDEATSALDAESECLVQEALERLMKDRTVITIAHRLSTIKRANQIAVLSEGKIIELGSYETLMSISDGCFRKLVEKQTIFSDK